MFEEIAGQEFGVMYVISQVFALVGTFFALYAMQKKKKVDILTYNLVGSLCAVAHYLFLGAWSGMAVKIVSSLRNGSAIYETRRKITSKILPFVFAIFYIVGGIISYESAVSLLAIFSPVLFTLAIYWGNEKIIRYTTAICSVFWLIYNIFVFSIVGIISEVISVVNVLVAIWRYRKKPVTASRRKVQ